jgi:hypothetical protein
MKAFDEQDALETFALKLQRAEQHLDTIDQYLIEYKALDPYRIISELNRDQTFYECRLQGITPPFFDFGILAGEVAYHLRSLLDHIVFALSDFPVGLSARDLDRAHRRTGFPILTREHWGEIENRTQYVHSIIRDEVRAIIYRYQPYYERDNPWESLLFFVDEINIIDKHRVINATTGSIGIDTTNLHPEIEFLALGRSVNERDIVALVPSHLDPDKDFMQKLTYHVTLPIRRRNLNVQIVDLRRAHNYIRDRIIPDFVPFFPKS